jgi:monoterpene epsilon-lactone hydrolase
MTVEEPAGAVRLPAREIPVPTTLSPQARAVLSLDLAAGRAPAQPPPALEDVPGWHRWVEERHVEWRLGAAQVAGDPSTEVQELEVEGTRVYLITPADHQPGTTRVLLHVHGGAMVLGGGDLCALTSRRVAERAGVPTWAVDYRMPPDHPYPTPLDDCLTAYRTLLESHRPEDIIVSGESAGGNLAAAMLLCARDEGLPLPAGAVLLTPEVDLTESGDSFACNLGLDNVLTESLMPMNLLYAGDHDLRDPYVSPLFGDFAAGFPPTLLVSGTRDLFLSNTVLLHRKLRAAGVPADLHVVEAAGHGRFFGLAPEDAEIDAEIRRFMESHWSGAGALDTSPHAVQDGELIR